MKLAGVRCPARDLEVTLNLLNLPPYSTTRSKRKKQPVSLLRIQSRSINPCRAY